MKGLFDFLFSTEYWPARWNCGVWTDALGYTHIFSDLSIFLAYYTIPCVLVYFIFKIKGVALEKVFILFALFIFLCGLTHLDEAIIFYYPFYRFAALIKILTAVVSWATVFALIPYIRTAATMPKLKVVNKQLAEQLQKEQERLQLAFEGTSAGIWEWNLNTGDCFFSQTFLDLLDDGLSREGKIDAFYALMHPDDQTKFEQALQNQLKKDTPLEVQIRIRMHKGSYRWFLVNGKIDENKRRLAGSIADIHEKKIARLEIQKLCDTLQTVNSELKETNKTLEEFSYRVAHDLKEPLRGVGMYTEMLRDQLGSSTESKEFLDKLTEVSEKGLDKIDILLKSVIKKEDHEESREVNVKQAIDEVVSNVIEPTDRYEIKVPEKLPTILINPQKFRDIFSNLITNALKYNDKKKKIIEIHCEEQESNYLFSVKDNGKGIPEDEILSIFEMFYRAKNSSPKDGGTGLGLAIVKRIVTSYGGNIWVESELGQGTTFYFTLPKQTS